MVLIIKIAALSLFKILNQLLQLFALNFSFSSKRLFFKGISNAALAFCCAVFVLLFLLSAAASAQVKLDPIVFNSKPFAIQGKNFYVTSVVDDRADKFAVAWIYPIQTGKQKLKLQMLDFEGKGFSEVQNLIMQSFPPNKRLRPIVVHLQECKITESLLPAGRVEGKVSLSLGFDLVEDDELVHLCDYHLDTKYNRPQNQSILYGKFLYDSFGAAFSYLSNWIGKQADHDPRLAMKVKVFFKDHQEQPEGDTIYYAAGRPLNWNDFQDKPDNSKFAAMVFPSFGFDEHKEVVNGEIRVYLDTKIYLPKSACWVKPGSENEYTLNHEQRHFDIVAIVAKKFQQEISALQLPVSNCDGQINVAFYESFREMNRLQKLYDSETAHGLNAAAQERWNSRINKQLAELGIRPKVAF